MIIKVKNVKNGRFSIAFAKTEGAEDFYVVHGNKIVDGAKGRFISGPAFKGNDDKWVNQTWMDSAMQDYVIGLVDAEMPQERDTPAPPPSVEDDIPF
jgi:DNA-binding cell septation regulator SpoVG